MFEYPPQQFDGSRGGASFYEFTISSVTPSGISDNPGWTVTFENLDNMVTFIRDTGLGVTPRPGSAYRLYANQPAELINGAMLDGVMLYWNGPAEHAAAAAEIRATHPQLEPVFRAAEDIQAGRRPRGLS